MHMNISEYFNSFNFILVKRTTSWQIAVLVYIYIDHITLFKKYNFTQNTLSWFFCYIFYRFFSEPSFFKGICDLTVSEKRSRGLRPYKLTENIIKQTDKCQPIISIRKPRQK